MTETAMNIPHILEQHRLWLRGDGGSRADLRGADLGGADLGGANLSGAELGGANLRGANLGGAYLGGAYLREANLRGADLGGANLSRADLRGADLGGADISGANLSGADISGAYIRGANLVDGGQRSDGYRFIGHVSNDKLMIFAGCRYFDIAAAREHWRTTRGGTPLGAETMVILDHIERVAVIRKMIEETP